MAGRATHTELRRLSAEAADTGLDAEFHYALGKALIQYEGPIADVLEYLRDKAEGWLHPRESNP